MSYVIPAVLACLFALLVMIVMEPLFLWVGLPVAVFAYWVAPRLSRRRCRQA